MYPLPVFYASANVRLVPEAFGFRSVRACMHASEIMHLTQYFINHLQEFHQLGTKTNRLDFDVKRLKVKVTARLHMAK